MKKYLLFTLVLVSSFVQAQEILPNDEELLIGGWTSYSNKMVVPTNEGEIPVDGFMLKANAQSSITLDLSGQVGLAYYTTFFVSDGNKLHFVSNSSTLPSLTFVITMFQTDPYVDGQKLLFIRPLGSSSEQDFIYRSVKSTNSVSSVEVAPQTSTKKFLPSGIPSETPDGIYIMNGKKYISK